MYKYIQTLVRRGLVLTGLLAIGAGMAAAREMTTDRPDGTESPFTVPAGRVQLELDFVAFSRDREAVMRVTEWQVAPINLRFGVSQHFELGVLVAPHVVVAETPPAGQRVRQAGFGDLTLRAKWNGAGNDEAVTMAWGLMADLKLPTAADGLGNGRVEGALILPLAFALGRGWSGGAMTGVEWTRPAAGVNRAVWINTFVVGRDLTETVGGFLELTSATGDGAHVATFNFGLTLSLGPDLQLDAGVNLGLSRSTPNLLLFAGLSRRF
ncbi:MAG: hypothetical protein RLZZ129_863 [Verrucomicrobiota bacterium]|jgi:hypothetical protein